MKHRPHLDGIRGIAVAMVVAQHALRINGGLGGAGVGLFFGLSGYLITGLLLGEASLPQFYLRRFARLIPALVVMLAVCDLLFEAGGDTAPVGASVSALAYLGNYAAIQGHDFLAGYGQTWSLAVEEHFYLLYPVLLLWLLRRFGPRRALGWTLGLCAASLAWRVLLETLHASVLWVNLDTFARADGLLYGCAAAIAVQLGWRPARWLLWPALAVIAPQVVLVPRGTWMETAGQASFGLATAVLVVTLDHHPSAVRSLLSARPLVALGAISYGVYLWHVPMLGLAPLARMPVWLAVAASVGCAWLSYRAVEQPVRAWARSVTTPRAPRQGSSGRWSWWTSRCLSSGTPATGRSR